MTSSENVYWVDGALVADGAAALRPDDHGLVGDGAFEAIKVIGNQPFALTRHLRRLQRSAAALGLTPDLDAINDGVATVCGRRASRGQNFWLRVTVTGGSAPMGTGGVGSTTTTVIALAPMAPWGPTCNVAIVPWTRNATSPTAGLKTISYADNVIALRRAHDHGADEAIFGNTSGYLCEGTGSNVFVAIDGLLVTPPLSSGCLAGVTRALLLEHLEDVTEADLSLTDLSSSTEAFLTSTSRDVHAIATVDGAALGAAPGPLTRHAIEVFAAIVADSIDP